MQSAQQNYWGCLGFLFITTFSITILAPLWLPILGMIIRGSGFPGPTHREILHIQAVLETIRADAEISRLDELFSPDGVRNVAIQKLGASAWPPVDAKDFEVATELYTRAFYAILRSGQFAYDEVDTEADYQFGEVLNLERLRKLTGAYEELGTDGWENCYNIYPGPWDAKFANGSPILIPFRIYRLDDPRGNSTRPVNPPEPDDLTMPIDVDLDGNSNGPYDILVGYPAPSDLIAYIWSNGLNLVSGQALYSAVGYDNAEKYNRDQDPELIGGGDDINNWDPGQSWGAAY